MGPGGGGARSSQISNDDHADDEHADDYDHTYDDYDHTCAIIEADMMMIMHTINIMVTVRTRILLRWLYGRTFTVAILAQDMLLSASARRRRRCPSTARHHRQQTRDPRSPPRLAPASAPFRDRRPRPNTRIHEKVPLAFEKVPLTFEKRKPPLASSLFLFRGE